MQGKIFFIVGVQRSGTTLLQKLLSQHPEVLMEKRSIAFRIITCFKNLYDLLPHNLQHDKKEFQQWLIENDSDGRLAELIDFKNIEKYPSLRQLIQQSIYQKTEKAGKKIWGDKSPNLQHFVHDLELLIPEAKIIHIVRDGRSNALSMSKRSYRNLKWCAQHWLDGNIFGVVNQDILGKENYKIVQYEKLLTSPEQELKSICDFLEIPFSEAMLDLSNNQLKEEQQYVKTFFDTSKIDNWKKELSPKKIKSIESIQGELLKKMGYELLTNPKTIKPLSLRRQLFLNQIDNFKLLFKRKRIGMKEQELIEMNLSFKNRLYSFLTVLIRDFFSLPIFKSLFSRYFYKKKYFQKKENDQA